MQIDYDEVNKEFDQLFEKELSSKDLSLLCSQILGGSTSTNKSKEIDSKLKHKPTSTTNKKEKEKEKEKEQKKFIEKLNQGPLSQSRPQPHSHSQLQGPSQLQVQKKERIPKKELKVSIFYLTTTNKKKKNEVTINIYLIETICFHRTKDSMDQGDYSNNIKTKYSLAYSTLFSKENISNKKKNILGEKY